MKIYAVYDIMLDSYITYCNTYELALSRRMEQAYFEDRDIDEYVVLDIYVEEDGVRLVEVCKFV